MNRPHILRWLRIGFTAACLLVCVLLIWLWERSYTWDQSIDVNFIKRISSDTSYDTVWYESVRVTLESCQGALVFSWYGGLGSHASSSWTYDSRYNPGRSSIPWWRFKSYSDGSYVNTSLNTPHWFASVVVAVMGALPWLSWFTRFSLRTLLITVTLLGILLAALVYFTR